MNKALKTPQLVDPSRKEGLKPLHTTGQIREMTVLDDTDSHDALVKHIKDAIDHIEQKGESESFLQAIYQSMSKMTETSFEMDEVVLGSSNYQILDHASKKKFLLYKLQEKYPDKEERERLVSEALQANEIDSNIVDIIKKEGKEPLLGYIAEVLALENHSHIKISDNFVYMNQDQQDMVINTMIESGLPSSIVDKYKRERGEDESTHVVGENNTTVDSSQTDDLLNMESVDRKGSSDFNPMLYDLDLGLGSKIFNISRFKEVYQKLFFKVVSNIISKTGGVLPTYNQLNSVTTYKIKPDCSDTEAGKQVYQYTIEWDIPEDIGKQELAQIVSMYNQYEDTLNPNASNTPKNFYHPIQTMPEMGKFFGHFTKGGNGFDSESIIIVENHKTKEKKLRLTLNNITQDQYTYILSQISYFIEHKSFIDKQQLFFNIYDNYNQEVYKDEHVYDISVFEQQYKTFMETLIIPLSNVGQELGLKAQNILLAGIYGGGKSQFLFNLLKNKRFEINNQNFDLNANTIFVDLQTFKAMLAAPLGGFRTKLDAIYQNTGLPIVLVIEDIDTLINEKIHGGNDEIAQAMTLMLEGIGSIPVTFVATANEPAKISERLIRPNRIHEIIEFYLPDDTTKCKILDTHLGEKGIKINDDLRIKLLETKVFKKGTASHIGNFCQKLADKEATQNLIGNTGYQLDDNEILSIAENINISSEDIDRTIADTKKWYKKVTGNEAEAGMGFIK